MFSLIIAFCTLGTTDCKYYMATKQYDTLSACEVAQVLAVNSRELDAIAVKLDKLEILGTCLNPTDNLKDNDAL